jgi:hypothetical protein
VAAELEALPEVEVASIEAEPFIRPKGSDYFPNYTLFSRRLVGCSPAHTVPERADAAASGIAPTCLHHLGNCRVNKHHCGRGHGTTHVLVPALEGTSSALSLSDFWGVLPSGLALSRSR